jgi:hypothetical protein
MKNPFKGVGASLAKAIDDEPLLIAGLAASVPGAGVVGHNIGKKKEKTKVAEVGKETLWDKFRGKGATGTERALSAVATGAGIAGGAAIGSKLLTGHINKRELLPMGLMGAAAGALAPFRKKDFTKKAEIILTKIAIESPVHQQLFKYYQGKGGKKPTSQEYLQEGRGQLHQIADRGKVRLPVSGAGIGVLTGAMMGAQEGYGTGPKSALIGAAIGGVAGAGLGMLAHHSNAKRIKAIADRPSFEAAELARYNNIDKGLSKLYKKKS